MQAIESAFQNNVLAIPWMLDAVDEDLDLEIHGCGCGCSCGCGCGCGCSCSCSCSCDDTGDDSESDDSESDDSSADDSSADEGDSANWGFDDIETVATSANQCIADVGAGVAEDGFQTGVAAGLGAAGGGPTGAVLGTAGAVVDDATGAAQESAACAETVDAFSQNESFQQAMGTYFAVGN